MPGPVKQLAVIPFTGGLDTKTDPRLVAPGKLLEAQNVVFKQTGSINRRWGYEQLATVHSAPTSYYQAPTVGFAISQYNDQLVMFDGGLLRSYSNTYQNYTVPTSAQALTNAVFNCTQKNQSIVRTTGQQISPDFNSLNGIDVYVWEDQTNISGAVSRNGVWMAWYETATGKLVQNFPISTNSTAIRPKVITLPSFGVFYVFWVDTATSGLYAAVFNTVTGAFVPTGKLLTLGTNFYDVAASPNLQPDGSSVIIVYSAATTNYATWSSLIAAGGIATTTTISGNPVTKSNAGALNVCFEANSTAFWFSYADNGTTSATASTVRYTSTSTATFVPVQVATSLSGAQIMALAGTTRVTGAVEYLWLFTEILGNPFTEASGQIIGQNQVYWGNVNSATGFVEGVYSPVFGTMSPSWGFGLASKPIVTSVLASFGADTAFNTYLPANNQILLNLSFQSPLQSCYVTIIYNTTLGVFSPVSQTPPGLGGGYIATNSDYILPEFVQVNPGILKYANLARGAPQSTQYGLLSLTGVQSTTLNFVTPNLPSTTIAGSLYIGGAIVNQYEGSTVVENNFLLSPEGFFVQATATTGGNIAPGVYYYAICWSWQDNNGLVQWSSPSPPFQITVPAGTSTNLNTVVFPVLFLSNKLNAQVRVFRTAANGLTFMEATTAQNAIYLNQTFISGGTGTFFDTYADATIAQNGAMYTQPLVTTATPVLENTAPPPCTMIAAFDERLFVAGLDNPLAYAFSQQVVSGIPLQFNTGFLTGSIDPDGGPITGMARLDSQLVFFKETAIFYISGTGPDATGQGSQYTSPQYIPSGGVGAISQNSIVLVPKGLMFQSSNGWYLLDRGLNVSYVGAPVEFYNNLTVTSATLIPNQWVIWTTTSGTAIVYDYFYDQWSTFTNHPAVGATFFNGLYYYLRADGTVLVQTPETFSDNGSTIPVNILTAKFALAQIQGYQRVYEAYLLGSYRGPGVTLTVGCAFDNEAEINAQAVVPVDNALGVSLVNSGYFGTEPWVGTDGSTTMQLRFDICRKCESIQFQISDSQSNPGYEGFTLSAITLNVGVKRGGYKGLPATHQFGVK